MKNEIFAPKDLAKEEYESDDDKIADTNLKRKGLGCLAGRGMFTINWDGTMSPCVSFPRSIVIAEPMKTGFEVAWKKINEAVKQFEIPEKCNECAIGRRCVYCPVKHSKVAHLHKCNEDVCEFQINKFNRNKANASN